MAPRAARSVSILSCDDHDLFREGLRHVLAGLDGRPRLLEAATGEEALRMVATHDDVGLVLLDLGLPDVDGFALLRKLRAEHPLVAVVVVSGSDSPRQIRKALDAGAVGFIPKASSRAVLLSALRLVLAGGVYVPPAALDVANVTAEETALGARAGRRRDAVTGLTPRQREVLDLMGRGLTNKEIADVLGIAALTVKVHVAAILAALEVSNRTEAVMVMAELGLLGAERS
jgi:DNA-binding NarL/FixJ family response regulator